MDNDLKSIVSYNGSIAESVDWELLEKHTRKISFAYLNGQLLYPFRWKSLRYLCILGCDQNDALQDIPADSKLQMGCWVDTHNEWLLVIGAPVTNIAEYVFNCATSLEHLIIRDTKLESLNMGHLTGLKLLELINNDQLIHPEGLSQLHQLTRLVLRNTAIGPELDLNYYAGLESLDISRTPIRKLKLESTLPNLRCLDAWNSDIDSSDFLQHLPELTELDVSGTEITELDYLKHCTNLEDLEAYLCKLTTFPSLPAHRNLTSISLWSNPIDSLDDVVFPPNLELLDLDRTPIREIPAGLRDLSALQRLNLSELTFDTLPEWLPEWVEQNEDLIIDFRGTTVEGIEAGLFDRPWAFIRKWLIVKNAEEETDGTPLNELKVVFLGDGGAGKSYSIARLMADGEQPESFPGISTPGIVIKDKEYTIGDRKVQIHFWDFGGQEILHSMHRMFLTDRTLYVVLLNVRDGTQDERARYWLHNIKSFAGNAPVLMVLNQMDENPNASINENDLRNMAPGMTETVKMSALKYSADEFNAVFTSTLLRQIVQMSETLDFFFPATWSKVKQSLQNMESHYIHGADYTTICEECGVNADSELRKALLQWFNDLGVSFCYSKDAQLEDYVILRPDWLTNAIYIILFNKLENVRNGIVPLQTIYKVLNPDPADRNKIRRVLPDVTYTQDEVSYVLNVIRRFRLSFQINGTEEFIPMLCDRNSLDVAAEYENDRNTLEFRMKYDYLPNNVLHRLMVQLRGHLDTDNVWLTGARFEQQSTGLSAVVKSEGNDLRIFVRSTKKIYPANTYLSFIKDELDRINRDMGLTTPSNLVIYKADGIAEEFDYDDLINALEDGEDTYRSRIRRKRIPIMDILNQTGHTADQDRDKLLQDIVSACMSMQSQKLYWHLPDTETRSKENVRNDNIREMLRAKGYIASDQSRSGRTRGGSQAGLLDIDIRRSPNVPWTIFEGLNISKADKKDTDYWDDHLKKLLDYYNPMGLPYLFLVSYLECSREDFVRISSAYNEHMRWHDPQSYERASSSFEILPKNHGQFISTAKCTYDRGGIPTTVYHICVRLGD